MCADGWITIFDADKVDMAGLKPFDYFLHVYERIIFGRRVYTVFGDHTSCGYEHGFCTVRSISNNDTHTLFCMCVIDAWEVWS